MIFVLQSEADRVEQILFVSLATLWAPFMPWPKHGSKHDAAGVVGWMKAFIASKLCGSMQR